MINSFKQLSSSDPYKLHYKSEYDNLIDIDYYDNSVVLDMFDTLASICYCEFYNKRNEEVFRINHVSVDVVNIDLFNSIKNDLNNLVSFMTNGELWNITFKKVDSKIINIKKKQMCLFSHDFNSIALLSGGLDALAGASQELSNKTLFVTYATNKVEKNKSNESFKYIKKLNLNSEHVIIPKMQFNKKKQTTQRTRSLVFIASALIYADYYKIPFIKIYENGVMSLNPSFEFRRRVTKTTHPRTLFYINQILKKIGLNIKVINPFQFKTKAEVINLIPDKWNDLIKITKTCSKMPGTLAFQNRKNSNCCHCGVCAACLLRQISMLSSKKDTLDSEYITPKNISSYAELLRLEKKYGEDQNKNLKIVQYKFIEKKSLLVYYKEFYDRILDDSITSYLELSPLFENSDMLYIEYKKMLIRFSNEVKKYLDIQK